ncbi:HipA family kinase [Sphingopyxis sp. RIFCSPHIGHO2_12_FULL_65_19]|uniref:HipA family kinase n=1 Tax=Sphingopyxis sp. RIFCSPHIGHO2_12_FULL_65_19 TaxID=1802172 RepID=UPI0025FB9FCE|nr:HipA family kinase [Sphingopyxis sp. RIFCSPHIGHO2_12_FULL_65_19]
MISTGKVLKGLVPHTQSSANAVFRGDVYLSSGEIRRAFIKDLDPRQLGNELLVATLAKSLGVSVPDAALVIVEPDVSMAFKKIPHGKSGAFVAFCSMDANGSTIAQILAADPASDAIPRLKSSPLLGKIYGFDAWVANIDRHRNNLILSGDGSFYLIDHGHCFTGPSWMASDLNSSKEYISKLKLWLTPNLNSSDKDRAMAEIKILTSGMVGTDVQLIIEECLADKLYGANDSDAVVGFLESRVSHVLSLSAKALHTL